MKCVISKFLEGKNTAENQSVFRAIHYALKLPSINLLGRLFYASLNSACVMRQFLFQILPLPSSEKWGGGGRHSTNHLRLWENFSSYSVSSGWKNWLHFCHEANDTKTTQAPEVLSSLQSLWLDVVFMSYLSTRNNYSLGQRKTLLSMQTEH